MHRCIVLRRLSLILPAALGLASLDCGGEVPDHAMGRAGEPVGSVSQQFHTECATSSVQTEGIDVSYWQDTVNWNAVAGDGIRFAISRVSHGLIVDDTQFDANWSGSKAVGLVRGAYQYFDPGDDPVAQAQVVVDALGQLGPGDLPAVIDVESTDGQSASTIAANIQSWVDVVEAGTGKKPMIYTGSYFWDDNVGTTQFSDHLLWTAHYTTGCPLVADAWDMWTFWQYTSSGSVAGISGNVDMNNFDGTWEELNDLAGNGYRASVISLDYPDTLAPGEAGAATLVLQNDGVRSWNGETMLGTTEPRDRPSAFAAPSWASDSRVTGMSEAIPEGAQVTMTIDLVAPEATGDYSESFNLVQEGVAWFSDDPPGGGPADDVITLSINVSGTASSSGTSSSGLGGSGTSSGLGGSGGGGGDDTAHGVSDSDESCDCSAPGSAAGRSAGWLLALCLLSLAVARPRRRER